MKISSLRILLISFRTRIQHVPGFYNASSLKVDGFTILIGAAGKTDRLEFALVAACNMTIGKKNTGYPIMP
jgi:hypothetical protein